MRVYAAAAADMLCARGAAQLRSAELLCLPYAEEALRQRMPLCRYYIAVAAIRYAAYCLRHATPP